MNVPGRAEGELVLAVYRRHALGLPLRMAPPADEERKL